MNKETPLIHTYLKRYQEDPTSRVFAPLAEAYRKAGMVQQAIEIAREGLVIHPQFIGGRVALARALFDKKDFEGVIEELGAVIKNHPDNILAQKLYAEACLSTGRLIEALGAYKMLLYLIPNDLEFAQMVQKLEEQAYEGGRLVLRTDEPINSFLIREVKGGIEQDPEFKHRTWMSRIEKLQGLLQRVERYRASLNLKANS